MMSSDDYVMRGGVCCPDCESEEITTGRMKTDVGVAWQVCLCDDCGMEWEDKYNLVGYDPL